MRKVGGDSGEGEKRLSRWNWVETSFGREKQLRETHESGSPLKFSHKEKVEEKEGVRSRCWSQERDRNGLPLRLYHEILWRERGAQARKEARTRTQVG